jgi:hypothetical protein
VLRRARLFRKMGHAKPREQMQVAYVLNEDDWIRFNEHVWRSSASLQRGYRRGFLLGPVIGLAALVNLEAPSPYLAAAILLFASVVFWCFYPGFHRRLRHRQLIRLVRERAPKGNLGPHQISVSSDGLHEVTEYGEGRLKWSGVSDLEETPDHIFIYTGAAAAYIVPKRAFASPEQSRAFLEAVRSYWQAAGGDSGQDVTAGGRISP